MSEVIHFAAPALRVGTVTRQRCAWCGALIDERDVARMAVQVDETASAEVQDEEVRRAVRAQWSGLVAIDGNVRWTVDDPADSKVPPTSCMALGDEATK